MEDSDVERRQLMDEFVNAIIGINTVGRLAEVSYNRIEQEIADEVYRKYLWRSYLMICIGSRYECTSDGTGSANDDQMISRRIYPIVLWRGQEKTDMPKHEWGCMIAEHNPNEPVFLKLRVMDKKESLHNNVKRFIDNDGCLTTDIVEDLSTVGMGEFEKHGPAIYTDPELGSKFLCDVVFSLKCQSWPSSTDDYFTRERLNNWPSQKLLDRVSRLDCFVVPVGHPSTASKNTEWRLSFSVAEKELIHKLPEPYAKCIYALKALKSKHLVYSDADKPTPFCSYFMKTACLWMCETFSHKDYRLMDLIRKSIDWLIVCYQQRNLPHYFIPKQNMIAHLSRELSDGVKLKLTAVRRDLWKTVMSSVPIKYASTSINAMCDALKITIVDNDYTELENCFLNHPMATYALLSVNKLLLPGAPYDSYTRATHLQYSTIAGLSFHSFLDPLQDLVDMCRRPSEILKFPEEVMMPIVDNIDNIVPGGYVEMFKQRLYRFIGDVYAYLLVHFRGSNLDIDLNKALYYYGLGAEMVYPDKRRDRIGGQAVVVIYHYIMGNYRELKEILAVFQPIVRRINEDSVLMNRLFNVDISRFPPIVIDAWAADKILQHLVKHSRITPGGRNGFHPIALVFYINARLSLIEGDRSSARAMVKEMEKCLRTIYGDYLKHTTKSLITIIESQIGLLEVMRMLYLLRV